MKRWHMYKYDPFSIFCNFCPARSSNTFHRSAQFLCAMPTSKPQKKSYNYVDSRTLAIYEECRQIVILQIEFATTLRYEAYLSKNPDAVRQAWVELYGPSSNEEFDWERISVGQTTHEQRYTILKDKETFKPINAEGHGKTKERLEILLWNRLPQLCDSAGSLDYGSGFFQCSPDRRGYCQWSITKVSDGEFDAYGILVRTQDMERLVNNCQSYIESIQTHQKSAPLEAVWKPLKERLVKLEGFRKRDLSDRLDVDFEWHSKGSTSSGTPISSAAPTQESATPSAASGAQTSDVSDFPSLQPSAETSG